MHPSLQDLALRWSPILRPEACVSWSSRIRRMASRLRTLAGREFKSHNSVFDPVAATRTRTPVAQGAIGQSAQGSERWRSVCKVHWFMLFTSDAAHGLRPQPPRWSHQGKQRHPGVQAPKVIHGEAPRGASTQSITRGKEQPGPPRGASTQSNTRGGLPGVHAPKVIHGEKQTAKRPPWDLNYWIQSRVSLCMVD